MSGTYNSIVRIVADASDFESKMKKAGVTAERTGKKIKESLSMDNLGDKIAEMTTGRGGFSVIADLSSGTVGTASSQLDSLRQYRDRMAELGFNQDSLEWGELSETIRALEYDLDAYAQSLAEVGEAERKATELAQQAAEAKAEKERAAVLAFDDAIRRKEKSLKDFESATSRIRTSVGDIMGWSYYPSENIGSVTNQNVRTAEKQLATLREYQRALKDFAPQGMETTAAQVAGKIMTLEFALDRYAQSLNRTADAERETADEADNLGDKASLSESFVSRVARALRNMGSSGRQLNPVSGIIRRIGDSADRSNMNISRMIRTIRNVSVVSFGLRIVRGLFGELGTVVRNYISQDAALQAQVNGLSASFGNVLAPAIHLVTGALSYVLPYVVGVSNAIGQLMGALFGTGWSAGASGANKMAAATGGAAKAQKELNRQLMSFDQINKVESQKDTGAGGGGGAGSAIAPIEGKTPAWAEHLKNVFTDLFESAEFQAANTGGKIGMILNTAVGEATSALANVDFTGAGSVLADNFNSMIGAIDWNTAGQLMGMALVALPSVAVGFIQSADWPLVGQSVSQFLMSSLGTVSEWIRSVDWLQVGTALGMFIANVDYAGIAQSLGTAFGLALGAIGATLWSMIKEPWQQFGNDLRSNMELFGGDAVAGFFYTMGEALADVGTWLWENFCKPVIDGVKEGFGIHSPSKVFGDIGDNCVNSLADRFGAGVTNILQKVEDLKSRVTDAASRLKEAFSFEWSLPHLRLPHLQVDWDPVDNVLAQFFGVSAFPRLSVQWFAKGGILDGAQIFGRMGSTLLGGGERGREAILPLDTNTGWMDVLANRISQSLSLGDGNDVNAAINIILDGEKIASYFIRRIRQSSRAGTTSF